MLLDSIKLKIHRYLNRKYGAILIYHSIVNCKMDFDMWTHMPLDIFEAHMKLLKKEANVISLADMVTAINKGRLPQNSVVLTFDDGFANNFTRALPVLEHYKLPATIFLSTGFIGSRKLFWPERLAFRIMRTIEKNCTLLHYKITLRNSEERRSAYLLLKDHLKQLHPLKIDEHLKTIEDILTIACDPYEDPLLLEWLPLDWNQISSMLETGLIEFGGHTADHHILSRLTFSEANAQISACRNHLDANIQPPTSLWAYPNGEKEDFNSDHKLLVENQGFPIIVTTIPSYISENSDYSQLGRIGIGSHVNTHNLRDILSKRSRWEGLTTGEKYIRAFRQGMPGSF